MTLSVSMDCLRVAWPVHLSELDHTAFAEKSPTMAHSPRSAVESDKCASPEFLPPCGDAVFLAWKQSRACRNFGNAILVPGAQRPLNRANIVLAFTILRACAADCSRLLCAAHPWRTAAMMALNVVRGVFPAFKGYSQALILNELQMLWSSENFAIAHLARLVLGEVARMALEGILDSLVASNEASTKASAQFVVEHQLLSQRARLDAPALADPTVRDLLQESELFAGSFAGTGGMGMFSPLEAIQLLALLSELLAHVYILVSLTRSLTHLGILLLSLASYLLPMVDLAALLGISRHRQQEYAVYTAAESRSMERQLKMRTLIYGDMYRSELLLFGLSDWILESWASARRTLLGLEHEGQSDDDAGLLSTLIGYIDMSSLANLLQNLPLFILLQSPASSLGSVAMYRNSIHSLIFASRALFHTVRTGFSSIFLMGAFCAAMRLEPWLKPSPVQEVSYTLAPGGGMKIEARGLTFTYPGAKEPALKGISFDIEAGQSVAIVGYNGSREIDAGETAVAAARLRLGLSVCEWHRHPTNRSSRPPRALGGSPPGLRPLRGERRRERRHGPRAGDALQAGAARSRRAGGRRQARSRPSSRAGDAARRLRVRPAPMFSGGFQHEPTRHGLSGGEWQRIAIARAFMRASRPEVDLMVFDEPTSALDGHAQNDVFNTIEELARPPSGMPVKTVIFITHRLATARRADKIIMLENGTITDTGSHEELMARDGPYAALYRASV